MKETELMEKDNTVAAAEPNSGENTPPNPPKAPEIRTAQIPKDSLIYSLWTSWQESSQSSIQLSLEDFCDEKSPLKPCPLNEQTKAMEKLQIKLQMQKLAQERQKQAEIPTKPTKDTPEGETPEPIKMPVDAQAMVHLSQNKLMAWIFVFPPLNEGKDITKEQLDSAIKEKGITYGLEEAMLDRIVQEKLYFCLIPIAYGVAAVPGVDGTLTDCFPRQFEVNWGGDDENSVDYMNVAHFQVVEKGTVICNITLPQDGSDGTTVLGDTIPYKKGVAVRPPKGKNTELNEDGTQLKASIDGNLLFQGGAFVVSASLIIAGDVDYSTGNINFLGDVQIKGDVRENFSVHATGSITIQGLVEGATIEAHGDILIRKGVLGDNKAVIRTRKSVKSKFLENCSVYAGECVTAESIISSQVFSDDKVVVTTGLGTIIGGRINVANQIEANVIGSQSARITELMLGVLPQAQQDREDAMRELAAVRKQLHEIEQSLQYLERARPQECGEYRLKKSALSIKEKSLMKKVEDLDENMVEDICACCVISKQIYPRTRITIGGVLYVVPSVSMGCRIRLSSDRITMMTS